MRQIKEFETESKYTLKGIEMTLRFFHEVEGNPVLSPNDDNDKYQVQGIGIVAWVYDKAKRYYEQIGRITASAHKVEINTTPAVVYTKPTEKKRKVLIDIEGILND